MIKARSILQNLGLTSGYTKAPQSPVYPNNSPLKNENVTSGKRFELPLQAGIHLLVISCQKYGTGSLIIPDKEKEKRVQVSLPLQMI